MRFWKVLGRILGFRGGNYDVLGGFGEYLRVRGEFMRSLKDIGDKFLC